MASKADGARAIPWRLIGWGTTGALLLLPLVAMQLTDEVKWTASDFVFAGALFGIVGGTFELAVRRSANAWFRGGVAVALTTAFLLVWINAAVGIIGNEDNPANLMFLGVIAIALAGAIAARFRGAGIARAMLAAAIAQALIGVTAFALRLGAAEPPFFPGVLILIGFFALMWLLSAWMFRKAARS